MDSVKSAVKFKSKALSSMNPKNQINREIKFRVWDSKSKKFRSPARLSSTVLIPHYGLIHGNVKHPEYPLYYNPDAIIQQFTGLKDKNGKEIYEGDIIFVDDERWIVGFDLGTFGLKYNPDDKLTPLFQYNPKELLIVGNIFENPELLR